MDFQDRLMKFMDFWIDYRKFKGASAVCAVLLNGLLLVFKLVFCWSIIVYTAPFFAAHALLNKPVRGLLNKVFYVLMVIISLVLCIPLIIVAQVSLKGVWDFVCSLFTEPEMLIPMIIPIVIMGILGYWSLRICLKLIVLIFHKDSTVVENNNIPKEIDEQGEEKLDETRCDSNSFFETVSSVEEMTGSEFEHFCADLLRDNCYSNVSVTSASGDQGIDLLAEKDGLLWGFQCKRWGQQTHVGNDVIRETYAGKAFYHCDKAVVITTSSFTRKAVECAKELDIILWDRSVLFDMIGPKEKCFEEEQECESNIDLNHIEEETMTIDQQMISVVSEIVLAFGAGTHTVSRSELHTLLGEKYHTKPGSVIPSDYCYNRINDGIDPYKKPMLFEYLGKGQYRCLGENFPYKGNVYHKEQIVGICENGVRKLFD